jgi:hypothetical protein
MHFHYFYSFLIESPSRFAPDQFTSPKLRRDDSIYDLVANHATKGVPYAEAIKYLVAISSVDPIQYPMTVIPVSTHHLSPLLILLI